MSKIRLGTDEIKHIALFESMTGAKVKDFLREGDTLCFLVRTGYMGLAIGKKGMKVGKVRQAVGKNILVFEYDEDSEQFLKNMFHPAVVHGLNIVKTSDDITAVVEIERADRSRVIGQNGIKIRVIKLLAKRHHNIDEINLKTV